MPTPTYTPLANITLGSSASSVTFSNIPNTYRDLILVTNAKVHTSNIEMYLTFNNDTSNHTWVRMSGNGSSATSSTSSTSYPLIGLVNEGNIILQIMDYSTTDKHKTYLFRENDSSNYTIAVAGRWASTSAITSIKLQPYSYSLESGFTASLYGVIA